MADAYDVAIKKAVTDVVPNAGLSGSQKQFAIVNAVKNDILTKGVNVEFEHLCDITVELVQSAYPAFEPNVGSLVLAIAAAFHAGPTLITVARLTAPLIQAEVDKHLPASAAEPLAAGAQTTWAARSEPPCVSSGEAYR